MRAGLEICQSSQYHCVTRNGSTNKNGACETSFLSSCPTCSNCMEGFERPCAFNKPRARIAGFRSPRCSRSFVSAIFLRQNAMLMKMSFISFFEYGAVHSASHPHRPVPVHIAEFSMTFQDCHETGPHEGLVNISLNGQAFETHGRRPRICSRSSLSYISYNRSVLNSNLVFLHIFFSSLSESGCACATLVVYSSLGSLVLTTVGKLSSQLLHFEQRTNFNQWLNFDCTSLGLFCAPSPCGRHFIELQHCFVCECIR